MVAPTHLAQVVARMLNMLETPQWADTLAKMLSKELGWKVEGAGVERVVIDIGEGKTLGIYRHARHETREVRRAKLLTNRILFTLFPTAFPKMYDSGHALPSTPFFQKYRGVLKHLLPHFYIAYDINERIPHPFLHGQRNTERRLEHARVVGKEHVDIWEARRQLAPLGIRLDFEDLDAQKNTVHGVYVDRDVSLDAAKWIDESEYFGYAERVKTKEGRESVITLTKDSIEHLSAWMRERNYSEEDIRTVEVSARRLRRLRLSMNGVGHL
jgi:hypothetical protein